MDLRADVKHAVTLLLRSPLINSLIVAVLAVGLGGTVAMFSIVRGVMLQPLAFADADRLVAIETHMSGADIAGGFSSYLDFADWRAQARSFDRMGAYAVGGANLTGTGDPASVQTTFVSDDLLPMLGVAPVRGRLFPEGADRDGLPLVIVGERFWRTRLSADPAVLDRRLTLDGTPYTIAAVLPAAFQFPIQPDPIDFYIPLGSHPSTANFKPKRGAGFLHVVGHLTAGATLAAAQADLAAAAKRLETVYPLSNANRVVVASSLREELVGSYRVQLWLLMAAAGAVLLTTAANVAHLLVTRALGRRRELAIRSALGAGRARLVRQLLTESVVLSTIAGAAGLLLAWLAVTGVVRALPTYVPRLDTVRLDMVTLGVAAALTLVTGLLFGSGPAFRLSAPQAADALRDARGSSVRSPRALTAVVIAEVAVSLVLLTTAGLLTRSLIALERVDPGFRPDHLVLTDLALPNGRYPDRPAQAAFYHRLEERLAALPGVAAAAVATTVPLSGADLGAAFTIDGRPTADRAGYSVAPYYSVSPAFFSTLGIPVIAGRAFTAADAAEAPHVLVISASLAKKFFPSEDPIGKRLKLGFGPPGMWLIVGIVGDVKQRELSQPFQPQFYTPFAQLPWPFLTAIVRTASSTETVGASVRRAIADLDPDQPPGDVRTMDHYVSRSTATPTVTAALVGSFAGLAALVAAIGLYGVLAHAVARRRRELGIRLALGAQPFDLGWMVLREALVLGGAGVVLGLGGAVVASRLVRGLLYSVSPDDPATYATVALGVAVLVVAAALPPTIRSLRADPLEALRSEG